MTIRFLADIRRLTGHWTIADDQDTVDILAIILKAQQKWEGFSRILVREDSKRKEVAIFYKSVVLGVLL
jgi:hypothetical protein